MEGKSLLKRYLIAISVSLSVLVLLTIVLLAYLSGSIVSPIRLQWQNNHLQFSSLTVPDRGDLLIDNVEFNSGDLKLQIPRLRLHLGLVPPFLQAIEVRGMEAWLKEGDNKGNSSVRFSRKYYYRLLSSLKIVDARIHYISRHDRLDLRGVSLLPSARRENKRACLLSASFKGNGGGSGLQGNISALLDFDNSDATINLEGLIKAKGTGQPMPFNLKVHLPLPDSVTGLRASFLLEIPKIDTISAAKKAHVRGSLSINGDVIFSDNHGLEAKGRLKLPFGIFHGHIPMPFNPGKAVAYSFKSPSDFSRMDITLLPEGPASSKTRLKLGYEAATGSWQLVSDVQLSDLSGSRDADHAFEGLDLKIHMLLMGNIAKPKETAWKADMSWDRGQILIYPWFFDLSALRGSIKAAGSMSKGRFLVSRLELKGPFLLDGERILVPLKTLRAKGWNHFLDLVTISRLEASLDLERFYNILVKDPFSDSHPALLRFEPAGSLTLKTRGRVLHLDCLSDIRFSSAPLINGLNIKFPYPIRGSSCEDGQISWQAFFLNNLLPSSLLESGIKLKIRNNFVPLSVCRDVIAAGPLDLDLQHGDICVKKVLVDLGHRSAALQDICIKDLDIKKLFREFPYEMRVEAKAISADFRQGKLVFSGKIRAQIAGGTITASNIWLEPFAPIVRYGADISFDHLDLKVLTAPTAFGEVSGVIKGWIKGLVMSGIQPERFRLLIKNDESADVPKKISIKAIENLSILGGGQGSVSFLGYFFKQFSYKRIGISCSLNNDVFILHGLIKKGGKEYLVERGFLGGVNVINMNPGGRIRFKDMVERLQRIAESDKSKMEVR